MSYSGSDQRKGIEQLENKIKELDEAIVQLEEENRGKCKGQLQGWGLSASLHLNPHCLHTLTTSTPSLPPHPHYLHTLTTSTTLTTLSRDSS